MTGNCPRCATPVAAGGRFCTACGARLAEVPEPAPSELRFVTVVFCDVVGSTEMSTRLSPDVWGAILSRYFAAATEALSRVGGRVEKFIGDAIVAVFGAEQAREDDAAHAVRAACAIREHAVAEETAFAPPVAWTSRCGSAWPRDAWRWRRTGTPPSPSGTCSTGRRVYRAPPRRARWWWTRGPGC
ncbi:adenylate/guanylate cyclase domain-containing protein [Phytohabitans flavus]|uniref:adenylate/guanylate cyclase domain-containing protein n=1 Tax=Phytohabitans flavus TaxID=1076124 RepID=UPI00362876E8